jgi:mRNA-degrading endonuclease toxin of MazEF toxin-antitoxin module
MGTARRAGKTVSKRTYVPQRGELIHVNLGGTGGTGEMDGPHFALVISSPEFNGRTGLCIVVPATSKPYAELGALAIKLPELRGMNREGWVHIHHVRSIDYRERAASAAASLDLSANPQHVSFMNDVIDRLFSIVE